MKNLQRHKWADVIHAYAEGHAVQYRIKNGEEWKTSYSPSFDNNGNHLEWRVKPNITIEKYRMALTTNGVIAVNLDNASIDNPAEYDVMGFIKWIGDVVSIEVDG